jgi:hypothetical protein
MEPGPAAARRATLTLAPLGTISICAFAQIEMVGATGIEPVTPSMSTTRSNKKSSNLAAFLAGSHANKSRTVRERGRT